MCPTLVARFGPHKKQLSIAKMMIERGAITHIINTEDLVLLLNNGLSERYIKGLRLRTKQIIQRRKYEIKQVMVLLNYILHRDVNLFVVMPKIQYNAV
jgi:hypothetical protein